MTTRNITFEIESASIDAGHLRIESGCLTLHPTRWAYADWVIIAGLLDDGLQPVAHLEITDTDVAILSVEATQAEPVCNAVGGIS
jgi:hypothetical protein